jgi:tetratricopeptide (TPR) repeat protein
MDDLFKAEKIFENSNNYDKLTRCQATIANTYQVSFSNYPSAMEYMIKASETGQKANSPDVLFYIFSNWGYLYLLLGDYETALVYSNKAAEEAKTGGADIGKTSLPTTWGNLSPYRKYPEAIRAYEQARKADTSSFNADVYESNLADVLYPHE